MYTVSNNFKTEHKLRWCDTTRKTSRLRALVSIDLLSEMAVLRKYLVGITKLCKSWLTRYNWSIEKKRFAITYEPKLVKLTRISHRYDWEFFTKIWYGKTLLPENVTMTVCLTDWLKWLLSSDTVHKCGLCWCLSVRPSVRLSVTLVHCIQTAEDIKLLSRPGSPIILIFLTLSAGTQFQSRDTKYKG